MLRFTEETIRRKATHSQEVQRRKLEKNLVNKAEGVILLPSTEGRGKEEPLLREGSTQ